MIRYITCGYCYNKLVKEDDPRFDPTIESKYKTMTGIKGYAKKEFNCDLCNQVIPVASVCMAVSFYRPTEEYHNWEKDYVDEGKINKVSGTIPRNDKVFKPI